MAKIGIVMTYDAIKYVYDAESSVYRTRPNLK